MRCTSLRSAPLLRELVVKGYLTIPPDVDNVGWYSGGGRLGGKAGTLLLAGQVNYVGRGWGAFGRLGAEVFTTDAAGTMPAWPVTAVTAMLQAKLPQGISMRLVLAAS